MNDTFSALAHELDRESHDWLAENHPSIADSIAQAVQRGATPESIRAFIIRRVGVNRLDFARRAEAAARYLTEQGG